MKNQFLADINAAFSKGKAKFDALPEGIFKLAASVGSGKSTAIRKLCAGEYENYSKIYAAPTLSLIKEQVKAFNAENIRTKVIHSGNGRNPAERLRNVINSGGFRGVVITTHKSLLTVLGDSSLNKTSLKSWVLFLDEEAEVIKQMSFSSKEMEDSTVFTKLIDNGNTILKPAKGHKPELTDIAKGLHVDDVYANPKFMEIADSITSDLTDFYGEVSTDTIAGYSVMKPTMFDKFKQVVMIAAIFEDTLTHLIWERLYNIKFEKFDVDLHHDSHEQGHRVTISHLFPAGIHASKGTLEKSDVADQVANNVKAILVTDFIYSCNDQLIYNERKITNPIMDILGGTYKSYEGRKVPAIAQVPVKAHGLNAYQHFNKVAALAVTQPDGTMTHVIGGMIGKDSEFVASIYRLQTVYQVFGRTSIRDKVSMAPIQLIVLDETAATQMAEFFTGAIMLGQVGDVKLPPINKGVPRTRPKNMSTDEWSAQRKWLRYNKEKGLLKELAPEKQIIFDKYLPYLEAGKAALAAVKS